MISRSHIKGWIREHRGFLWAIWSIVGGAIVVALLLGPDEYLVRGNALLPRTWAILFFLSLWGWVGLRFIALWIWAWVVMAIAPVCLFVPLRYWLDADWLMPLLGSIVVISTLTVVAVVWMELRRRLVIVGPAAGLDAADPVPKRPSQEEV
jgi:hypothetical protein